MSSQVQRPDLYKTLEAVSHAFDSIWNVLREDNPFRDYAKANGSCWVADPKPIGGPGTSGP
jgi:hypothetical protein